MDHLEKFSPAFYVVVPAGFIALAPYFLHPDWRILPLVLGLAFISSGKLLCLQAAISICWYVLLELDILHPQYQELFCTG